MKKIILSIILCTFYFISVSQISDTDRVAGAKVNSLITSSELKVYPNPCKQEKVTIESNNFDINELSITNIAGKQIYLKKFPLPESKIQVELSEMPNGVYLVKIKTDDGKQMVKKLIVSKD